MFFHHAHIFRIHCVGTEFKFCWLPKRCSLTGKRLWLQYVYKQTAMWTGPGDNIFEHRYYDKHEFLLARLRDEV